MIFQLQQNNIDFPHPSLAEEDGLLAIGGDLSAERLIHAYHNGIFPWYAEGDPICWFAPHERCVIFPDDIYVSKSMKKIISGNTFEIKTNTAFEEVIHQCKTISRRGEHGTWINDEIEEAYIHLFKKGYAHSIEAWHQHELVGGMYGLEINGVFCGESMFSKMTNASKAVMIWICKQSAYRLLDCQIPNPHLMSMGAKMISQNEFLQLLHQP